MKGKYITKQILMACLSKPRIIKRDIHLQLEETMAERKRIMQQLDRMSQVARVIEMYLAPKAA